MKAVSEEKTESVFWLRLDLVAVTVYHEWIVISLPFFSASAKQGLFVQCTQNQTMTPRKENLRIRDGYNA